MVHFIFKVSRDTEVWQAHENIIEKKHQILVESAKLTGIQLEYTVLKFQGWNIIPYTYCTKVNTTDILEAYTEGLCEKVTMIRLVSYR